MTTPVTTTRRTFIKSSAAVGGALALGSTFNTAHAQGSEEIKVALVGCGGRGTGAVSQMFNTKGNVKLVAELSKVSYTSSAGLRVLLGATKDSRSKGGDLRLAGVQPNVLKVLELSGFTSILKVLDSLEEAVNSYSE